MAERLPFGQLTPAARPINAFIEPAKTNTPEPARPQQIGTDIRIGTIQRGSEGNVQGFNQAEQLAEALRPFNRALTSLVTDGVVALKQNQIEAGYYDELKNLQARATMSLQMQQEAGAANAAGQIRHLEKIDPPGAQLLQEANPWRAIGRRRALAQQAGSEIDQVLLDDLSKNQGARIALAPGSGGLMQQKTLLTQQVLTNYGLSENDPETAVYVVPKLNEAWDTYTAQHRKLYLEEVGRTAAEATGGGVVTLASDAMRNGVADPDNPTLRVMPGTPGFARALGISLTAEIDRGLSILAGDDRTKALEKVKANLGFMSNNPLLKSAVDEVRFGDASLPLDKRPRWVDANPVEYLEMQNKGLQLTNNNYEQKQQGLENNLDGLWYGENGPGAPGVVMDSEDYKQRIQQFRENALSGGYRDADGYIQKKYGEGKATAEAGFGLTAEQQARIDDWVRDLTPDDLSPENIASTRAQANQIAGQEATDDARNKRRKELQDEIDKKQKLFADMPSGTFGQIKNELKRDLGLPQIKALDPRGEAGSLLMMPGSSVAGAMAAAPQKLATFAVQLENLYTREVMAATNDWRQKHPGIAEIPASAQNVIVSQAIANARKSEDYKQIYQQATGQKPGEVGPGRVGTGPSQGTAPGPQNRGVPAAKAGALPDTTVKAYGARPVMDKPWLHRELSLLNNNKPASPALYELAKRAGTSTTRYMLEQLKFYPDLDQNGSVGQFLMQKLQKERSQNTISSANFRGTGMGMVPTGYNSFSPGSWLMNLIMPPAAAATQAPSYSRYGGGGSFEKPSSVVYESRSGQPGVDLYFESKRFPAVLGGVVKDVSRESGYGNYVVIESVDPATGRKVDVLYGHLADGVRVRPGQRISAGQIIGQQGGTGNVRSVDGTIASIDFFEPRPAGSRDMTPYSGFDSLRRRVVRDLQGGRTPQGGGGGGGTPGGREAGYLKRLAYLETRIRNIPNAEGSPGRGYFQAFPAFSGEAIADSGGIDPRDSSYDRASKATWAWIQKRNPGAAEAIRRGDYDTADRLLRNTWPSLPGGSQAQDDKTQREARRYLRG